MEKKYIKNPLYGKRVIFDGDSICHATSESNLTQNRGWAYRIGAKNNMDWHNLGISGATITAEMYSSVTGNPRHWVSRSIDKIHEKFSDMDYLIFEGGTNDADLLLIGSDKFGKLDLSDYSGNYDDSTFTGAVESLLYKAITYYPKAKIGFIIAQKMGTHSIGFGGEENKRRYYFNRVIEVCKKWGVPYIDLWEKSPLNPRLKCYYDPELDVEGNIKAGKAYMDGQHLTALGYDIISDSIEAWMMTL
jgi:lysophospholipase L1-like esterase